jgi:hypothetical protein
MQNLSVLTIVNDGLFAPFLALGAHGNGLFVHGFPGSSGDSSRAGPYPCFGRQLEGFGTVARFAKVKAFDRPAGAESGSPYGAFKGVV